MVGRAINDGKRRKRLWRLHVCFPTIGRFRKFGHGMGYYPAKPAIDKNSR